MVRTGALVLSVFMVLSQTAYAEGPSHAAVEACIREQFNKQTTAMFYGPDSPLCPSFMSIEQVTIVDTLVSGTSAQVKASVIFVLKKPLDGHGDEARICAGGYYGAPGRSYPSQTFPAGTRWEDSERMIQMQKWSSGWKC